MSCKRSTWIELVIERACNIHGRSIAYLQFTSTREKLSILVKTTCHDTIGGVKGFLDTVTVMDVDINIQDSWIISEQL